ncbi:UDP-glucose 4-epimerase, partial [mine drainage metagenome]
MQRAAVRTLIFSSSATVYGEPGFEQFREDMRCDPVNPYGRGKWMIEQVLADLAASEPAGASPPCVISIRSARTPAADRRGPARR